MSDAPEKDEGPESEWSKLIKDAEKVSPMDEEAIRLHEAFHSLQRAGFTERQALTMLGLMAYDVMDTSYQITIEDEDDMDGFQDRGEDG